MGEAAARAERAAKRSVFVYILVVCWVFAVFGRVVDFDTFFWCFYCSRRKSSGVLESAVVGIDGE